MSSESDLFSWGCPFSQSDTSLQQMTEGTSLDKLQQVGHAAEMQMNRLLQAAAVTFQVGVFLFVGPFALFYLVSLFWTDFYLIPTCCCNFPGWCLPFCWTFRTFLPCLSLLDRLLPYPDLLPLLVPVGHPLLHQWGAKRALGQLGQVMASLEIECCILPCHAGEDCRLGPQEKPPDKLPSSWHTLLWRNDCLCIGLVWTVYPFPRHYDQDLHLTGNILASTLPRVPSSSWWNGGVALLLGNCPQQARWRRSSNPDDGWRSRDDDGLQAQRDPAAPQPEEGICEDGHGGWINPGSLLCLWRD